MLVDKYKAVIFDLDGTLVYTTAEYRYDIVLKTLEYIGKSARVDLKAIDKFWFDADRNKTIEEYFGCDRNVFWKAFDKLTTIEERAKFTHIYEDAQETLEVLGSFGRIMAITTGAPKKIADMEIDLLPKWLFTKIISVTSTRYKAKPHPESLKGCLKFCRVKPIEAIYIGNSTEDGVYAAAAGVDFIYIKRREDEFTAPHTGTIHSLLELVR